MAFTTTTLSAAVAVNDTSITVASATGFSAGSMILIDQEMSRVAQSYVSGTTVPVLRGLNGTVTSAHPITANVTVGLASDFADASAMTVNTYPTVRARLTTSYTTAGAITLPVAGSDGVAILNSTVALAMTLANPTKDMDGNILHIIGNGKAAHTVTYTAGWGNGGGNLDVNTFATGGQQWLTLMACNGIWCINAVLSGTLTNITVTLT